MSRLAELLPRAQLKENTLATKLASAHARLSTLTRQIEQLAQYQSEFHIPNAKPSIVCDAVSFAQRLGKSIADLEARVPTVSAEVSHIKTLWQEARTRRIMLEKLIEQKHRETLKKNRRTENNKAEALVSLKHSSLQR